MIVWSSCPLEIGITGSCLNTTDWRINSPFNTKMTISKRRASTVYSRSNFGILDVTDLSDPSPVIYTPDDFFGFYDIILTVNLNQTVGQVELVLIRYWKDI